MLIPLLTRQVVFGTLIQWVVYSNHPSLAAAVGMAIILICGIYASVSIVIHYLALGVEVLPLKIKVNGPDDEGSSSANEPEYIALPTRQSEESEQA